MICLCFPSGSIELVEWHGCIACSEIRLSKAVYYTGVVETADSLWESGDLDSDSVHRRVLAWNFILDNAEMRWQVDTRHA